MTSFQKVDLRTGVTLNVALAGDDDAPPVILLHGFPESHRTWRELVPRLQDRFRLIMPDQRGFAGSDKPRELEAYRTETLVDDIFALAEALGLQQFALVGHDWGGAIAWTAALRGDPRLRRLSIINAPHPFVFQKSLIEDEAQRAASQYITAFRAPGFEKLVELKGFDWLLDRTFSRQIHDRLIPESEKRQYLAEWSQAGAMTAMLNWYRASRLVVPPPGITGPIPDWLHKTFPKIPVPTLVIWGMDDTALLPIQLEGLESLIEDLAIVRMDAGHFVPWEAPDEVAEVLAPFLAGQQVATAAAQ